MTDVEKDKQVETGPEEKAVELEVEPKGQAADVTAAAKQDYDKARQQLDQERANAKRAREALEAAESEKEQLSEQVTTLQTQMAGLQKQLKEQLTAREYKELASLDPETTVLPDAVKAFQQLTEKLAAVEARAQKAEAFVERMTQREQQEQTQKSRQQMEEEIYSDCDEEFGAQFRNDAIKRANKLIEDGEVNAPTTPLQGVKLMRRCYREVAAESKPKPNPKKSVPTDTGLRGLSVNELADQDEFKPGTLDEVAQDMAKKMKAKKWNPQAWSLNSP